MKTTIITFLLALLAGIILPGPLLIVGLITVMILDGITGVLRAIALRIPVKSNGLRNSLIKFIQYFGSMLLVIILGSACVANNYFAATKVVFFINTVVAFLIFIEGRSILENIYDMAPKSPISIYFIQPFLSLLTNKLSTFFDKYKDLDIPDPALPHGSDMILSGSITTRDGSESIGTTTPNPPTI